MTKARLLWSSSRAHRLQTLPLFPTHRASSLLQIPASTKRCFSSVAVNLDQKATLTQPADPSQTVSTPTYPISTSLIAARTLLNEEIGGDQFWSNRLAEASLDLTPRRKRISIYGDHLAAPDDVISALLQTPFSDTSEISSFIVDRQRHESAEVLQFSFGSLLTRDINSLSLPSGWLEQSGADLFEINGNPLPHLLRSDVTVLVVDPYRLLDAESISRIPRQVIDHSHIVINGHLPPRQTQTTTLTRLKQRLGLSFSGTIHFSNARAALDAYDILRTGGTSPQSVREYQKLFLSSDIGTLQRELANARTISPPKVTLSLAVRHARSVTQDNTAQVQQILHTIRDLRNAASAAATRARHLSVASKRIEGGMIQGSIGASKVESASRISSLFSQRLSWLSLLLRLRVDDIADELEREIARAFVDVEQQLVYEAGQLSQIQNHLSKQADQIVRHPAPPFGSAILVNRLSTLSLSIPAVEANTLIEPIQRRRLQLVTESVPQTHSSARRILYQGYLGAAAGITASWAAYVPPLEVVSSTTALGLGILSVVGSVYWGQIRWQKTQKAFWRSWDRCTELLQSDVKASFESTVDSMVIAKPNAAADGLEELVERRLSALDTLEQRIEQLEGR